MKKTGKYTCYDANGKEMYKDVDVEKGRRFPPSQEGRMLLRRTVGFVYRQEKAGIAMIPAFSIKILLNQYLESAVKE